MNKKQSANWFLKHPILTGIFAFAIIMVVVLICVSSSDDILTNTQIGEQVVYDSIDNTIDCEGLQNAFNIAMDNVERRQPGDELRKISFSYANYANERMKTLSC